MATNAAQRVTISDKIMRLGQGVTAIANPRGASVDAILLKAPLYKVPANATSIGVWTELTGDNANANYLA